MLTFGVPLDFRGGVHLFIKKPSYAIGSVPSVSGHAIAYRWRSLPRLRQNRVIKPQGCSQRVLPWQVTMDQIICASLPQTHYWYEVGDVESTGGRAANNCMYVWSSLMEYGPIGKGCQSCSRSVSSACPISILRLNLVLTHGISPAFRGGVNYFHHQPPSGKSRVKQVTQLRTDVVHCRESARTGPVVLKVVPVTGGTFCTTMDQFSCAPLFPRPFLLLFMVCMYVCMYVWSSHIPPVLSTSPLHTNSG